MGWGSYKYVWGGRVVVVVDIVAIGWRMGRCVESDGIGEDGMQGAFVEA